MARRLTWATDGIAKLAKDARSGSVQLSALRAILFDMTAVSHSAMLEERLGQVEEKLNELEQTGADRPG
jgi:hypothetical protein